jgi:hypothetical protein
MQIVNISISLVGNILYFSIVIIFIFPKYPLFSWGAQFEASRLRLSLGAQIEAWSLRLSLGAQIEAWRLRLSLGAQIEAWRLRLSPGDRLKPGSSD